MRVALVLSFVFALVAPLPAWAGKKAEAKVAAMADPVPALADFIEVPFKKLLAFPKDYHRKWVKVSVVYQMGPMPTGVIYGRAGLSTPEDYFFGVNDPVDISAVALGFFVSKADSDPMFDLKNGDQITVYGRAHDFSSINPEMHLSGPSNLIVHAVKVVPVESAAALPPPAPQSPVGVPPAP